LGVALSLRYQLVAIGASAAQYYPRIAGKLGAELAIPPGVEVANAIGAAVSGVLQRASALITLPRDDCFRVHSETGTTDFANLREATVFARDTARKLAIAAAYSAGAGEAVQCDTQQRDSVITGPDGYRTFLQSRITAIASGQPQS